MVHLFDTHVLVWFLDQDPRLSPAAKNTLANPNTELVVPTIVLAEITHLYARGRISISPAVIEQKVLQSANCRTHSLDKEVVSMIPGNLDIHDAIIVATAMVLRDIQQQPTPL